MENETILKVVLSDDTSNNKKNNAISGESLSVEKYNNSKNEINRFGRGVDKSSRTDLRENAIQSMKEGMSSKFNSSNTFSSRRQALISGGKQYLSNVEMKTIGRAGLGVITTGAQAYGMYSQHKTIGYQLSGASHAADVQNRRNQMAQLGVSVGIATVINPALAPIVLGMKAWQLAQQNRQELYKQQSSQIISGIMQELLVKNTVERRF